MAKIELMPMNFIDDTIAAISTPVGQGGIGIVRLSGQKAVSIADSVFRTLHCTRPTDAASHRLVYSNIIDPALGYETKLHDVEKGRPNIYAKLKDNGKGRHLNFCGHIDTVPVVEGWDTDPFKAAVRGKKLHGLGSNDMKGGIACTLNMLRAFSETSHAFNGVLSFAGVIDEEAYGEGAKAMLKTEYGKADAVVVGETEPAEPGLGTPLGITGKILYDIHVHGRAAHSFHPEEGVNAVEDAGLILANLHKLKLMKHPKLVDAHDRPRHAGRTPGCNCDISMEPHRARRKRLRLGNQFAFRDDFQRYPDMG